MRCPERQHGETRVVDSRTSGEETIRRRRECGDCGARFTTHERVEQRLPWVVKKDGRREPFSSDKLLHGVALACRKRPLDAAAMDELVRKVVAILEGEAEVSTQRVGEEVLELLREVDEVAYVRFASVYREFETVERFVEIVDPLRGVR